jgi:hypothetical protein
MRNLPMEEQQDKDCYHYEYKLDKTHERMKYIKQNHVEIITKVTSCKISQTQQLRRNWRKTYDTLQKEIRMQTEAWNLLDRGS